MGRLRCAKYILTLLASTALTFHLLHSKIDDEEPDNSFPPTRYVFPKNFLPKRLSWGSAPPRWIVLPGNVTVHEGRQDVPFDLEFEMDAGGVCRKLDSSRTRLLIFVASRADHLPQRSAIRETWGLRMLQEALNFRVVFLLGRGDEAMQGLVADEGYRYGDLVQINLTESFRNLGRKSVAGLQWTRRFCPQAEFLVKTDDDILLHVPNLLAALSGRPLLLCHQNRMRKILRSHQVELPPGYHKYEVSEDELPGEYYPPYCSGMAYAFSSEARDRLLRACLVTPAFFIEDVYLTGFCRHKAGVPITAHAGITLRPPLAADQAAACAFRDGRITSQELDARELRRLWAELNTQGFFCPEVVGYARTNRTILDRLRDAVER